VFQTRGSRGFPQSSQVNYGKFSWSGHDRLLPNPFQFVAHQSSYHSTLKTEILAESWNKAKRYNCIRTINLFNRYIYVAKSPVKIFVSAGQKWIQKSCQLMTFIETYLYVAITVFWDVMLYSSVDGYQRLGGSLKKVVTDSSEMFLSVYWTIWCDISEDRHLDISMRTSDLMRLLSLVHRGTWICEVLLAEWRIPSQRQRLWQRNIALYLCLFIGTLNQRYQLMTVIFSIGSRKNFETSTDTIYGYNIINYKKTIGSVFVSIFL
jgi:hypothetical protein